MAFCALASCQTSRVHVSLTSGGSQGHHHDVRFDQVLANPCRCGRQAAHRRRAACCRSSVRGCDLHKRRSLQRLLTALHHFDMGVCLATRKAGPNALLHASCRHVFLSDYLAGPTTQLRFPAGLDLDNVIAGVLDVLAHRAQHIWLVGLVTAGSVLWCLRSAFLLLCHDTGSEFAQMLVTSSLRPHPRHIAYLT